MFAEDQVLTAENADNLRIIISVFLQCLRVNVAKSKIKVCGGEVGAVCDVEIQRRG